MTTELGRQYVWGGFPWILLGYSQVTALPVAQAASIVGVYGLSALVARSRPRRRSWLSTAVGRGGWLPGSLRSASSLEAMWGHSRLSSSPLLTRGQPVRVAVLQGNVEQEQKWDPAKRGGDHQPLSRHDAAARWRRAPRSSCGPSPRTRCSSSRTSLVLLRCGASRSKVGPRCSSAATRSSRSGAVATPMRRSRGTTTRPSSSARTAPSAPYTGRCTSCRSASTFRSSRCCFLSARSSRPCPTSRPGTDPVLLPVGRTHWRAPRFATR